MITVILIFCNFQKCIGRERKKKIWETFFYILFSASKMGKTVLNWFKKKNFVMFLGFRITVQAKFAEALRRVKKQQIKLKFWIWGPITVYYCTT